LIKPEIPSDNRGELIAPFEGGGGVNIFNRISILVAK
jgi:hypothetical protein